MGHVSFNKKIVCFAVDSSAHSVNDDDGITGATKVMKLIYYASLYGGERDTAKVRFSFGRFLETSYGTFCAVSFSADVCGESSIFIHLGRNQF